MTDDADFARLVSLACHDLRTPLATVFGFARTLERGDGLDERSRRFLGMISEASDQMAGMLDELGTAARIEAGRWEPGLVEADTLELAVSGDERVVTTGRRRDDRDRAGRRRPRARRARDRRSPARAGRAA